MARFWLLVYSLAGLGAWVGLALLGFSYLVYLALPGIPVFIWHLTLVRRRSERRQMGVELVGAGVLALSATAAYWVSAGEPACLGWWLGGLAWLQSSASIVYAYLRLAQRALPSTPPLAERLRMGSRSLLYSTFNLAFVIGLGALQVVPRWLFVAYLIQWLEAIFGTFVPAIGAKPTSIGFRQLFISIVFTFVFILSWRIQ